MKNINLVIQRTFNGLEVVYNDEFVKTLENKEGISDERKDAAQIAHRSNVYSIYNDEKFSVFSFINTNTVDVAKREGFYAIRLFIEKGNKIQDVKTILDKINEKFQNYLNNNDFGNQNYDDILNNTKLVNENDELIVPQVIPNVCYYYIEPNRNIDSFFEAKDVSAIKKLYLFSKEKAQGESVAREFGLKPITEITKSIKKVKVENHDYYLEHILVNDKPLNYKNLPEFTILCTQNDAITYKNKNSKKAQSFTGNLLQVLKPQPTYPHKPSNENNSKTPVLNYVMIGLLGLLLGGIGGYFGGEFFKKEEKAEAVTEAVTYPEAVSTTYVFKLDKDSKGYTLVPDNITELSNYKFKYDAAGKWLYNENGGTYKELDKVKLKELIHNPSSDSLIISSLENISNQTIPNQIKPETVAPTNPITTTPTTPEVPKTNVVEKKVEKLKPEKKVEKSTPAPKVQPKKENTPKPENSNETINKRKV